MTNTQYYLGIDLQLKIDGKWRYFLGWVCNRLKTEEEKATVNSDVCYMWDFDFVERPTFSNDTVLPITIAKKSKCALFNSRDTVKEYKEALARYGKETHQLSLQILLENFFASKWLDRHGEQITAQDKITKVIIGKASKTRTFKKGLNK